MESRINEEKADALLKWVNTANISSQVNSLQELSNAKLLMKIVHFVDKDYQVEGSSSLDDNSKWLTKVVEYLEYFYHQPLADFVDQKKITDSQNILEIGKLLSLLLCCAVQGENVSECIEKITSLEEKLQFQLKIVIEAVLKDLDNGRIDSDNLTDALCQSESFREVPAMSEEYQSSPIVMSPVSLYNSPIKALMASPQMLSRQSQVTISKLYKRLNQFQIKINNLQRTQSDLQHEIEEKKKHIEQQELKIQSMSKEVTKVPGLEEEVESLTRFETELDDVNRKCDRLRKSTGELKKYKEQFLKLEKEYSEFVAEKEAEKLSFEKCLKEVKNKSKEELQCVQSLLNDSNKTCDELRIQLHEASTAAVTMEKQLREQQSLYAKEIEMLKKALAESKTSREKLCLKSDQDVLRSIAREAELKQCFREQEESLQASIDQIQLQNCELKRSVEQLQINLNEEEAAKTTLESSLALSQTKLTDALCKYERLQSDFVSLGSESKITIDKVLKEKDDIEEALKKAQTNRDLEIVQLRQRNEELQGQSRCFLHERDEAKLELLETLKNQELLQTTIDNYTKEKSTLIEENILLKEKLAEEGNLALELKQLQDSSDIFRNENASLLKENASLRDDFEEKVMALQSSLRLAYEEKTSVIKVSEAMKERIRELELLSNESTNLQGYMKVANEQLKSLKNENLSLKKQAQQLNGLSEELTDLRNSLCVSNEEKHSLQETNSSLQDEIAKLVLLSAEYNVVQGHLKASNEEKSLLSKENADLQEKMKHADSECVDLRQSLDVVNKERESLAEENALLKDKLKHPREAYNSFQSEKETSFVKEKLAWNRAISPMKAPDNEANFVLNHDIHAETKLHENKLLVSKLGEIMRKFKVACKQDKEGHISAVQEDDMVKIEADLSECYATIVDQCTKYKQNKINDHKACLEILPNIMEGQVVKLGEYSETSSNEEMDLQIHELQKNLVLLEEENSKLKEFEEKRREELLTDRAEVEELKKNLRVSEKAMKELNNNNVDLELEMLTLQDEMKKVQDENVKVQDEMKRTQEENMELQSHVPQVEAKLVDLEKKLVEEEFISKRLAVEVRSLEAQLSYADRQLRQKVDNEETKTEPRGSPSREIKANACKIYPVTEDTAITEDSAVSDDSLVSEVSLRSEKKEASVRLDEHVDNTNMACKQEEVLKRLRRRSAVYSKKNSRRSEINDKRRSTIGTESFVVGQFSNTEADEPEYHNYEWDRILELKIRNSTCLPHMRSSYPVETQVRLKEEVEEEDLKSTPCTTHSRKRLRDNVSDSSIFTTLDVNSRCLPRSKSEDAFGTFLREKMTAKLDSLKSKGKNDSLISTASFPHEKTESVENNDTCNPRRESIAFKVDITPAKKSRMAAMLPRKTRTMAAEKKETVRSKGKVVKPAQNSKKFTLQRKSNTAKDNKRPLRTKNSNYAV